MTAPRPRQRTPQTPSPQSVLSAGWAQLVSLALALCLLAAPSNLFLKFDQVSWAVRGLRVDYLLPKLYVSDLSLLLALGLLLLWRYRQPISLPSKWPKFVLLGISVVTLFWLVRQVFTPYPIAAVVGALRLLSYGRLWWEVRLRWTELKHAWLWWALTLSVLAQSSLALFQFMTQHSLGSYRWLLGEPDLVHTYSIVHGTFSQWGELILPYGTTAHPNVLAGWVIGGSLLLIAWWRERLVQHHWSTNLVLLLTICFSGIVLWLTQAWSATGLLLHGLVWLSWTQVIKLKVPIKASLLLVGLTAILLSSPWWLSALNKSPWLSGVTQKSLSWERRVWLSEAAIKLWQQQPWIGVGYTQFTAYLETATHQTELVRFVQPAHHVGWLWLAETGLLGVVLVASWSWLAQQQDRQFWSRLIIWFWISLPVLMWDHYLLTIPTGLWLSFWWLLPKKLKGSSIHA